MLALCEELKVELEMGSNFNGGVVMRLKTDVGRNDMTVAFTFYSKMGVHITGTKTPAEFVMVLSFLQRFATLLHKRNMKKPGQKISIKAVDVESINLTINLSGNINRMAYMKELKNKDIEFKFITEKHAAVRYAVPLDPLKVPTNKHPTLMVFESGCAIIVAGQLKMLPPTLKHFLAFSKPCKVAGQLQRARGSRTAPCPTQEP